MDGRRDGGAQAARGRRRGGVDAGPTAGARGARRRLEELALEKAFVAYPCSRARASDGGFGSSVVLAVARSVPVARVGRGGLGVCGFWKRSLYRRAGWRMVSAARRLGGGRGGGRGGARAGARASGQRRASGRGSDPSGQCGSRGGEARLWTRAAVPGAWRSTRRGAGSRADALGAGERGGARGGWSWVGRGAAGGWAKGRAGGGQVAAFWWCVSAAERTRGGETV